MGEIEKISQHLIESYETIEWSGCNCNSTLQYGVDM